jgi:hypothetical protein
MRLPGSLHRKFKKEATDYKNSFICVPCPILKTRFDSMDENGNEIVHVAEF